MFNVNKAVRYDRSDMWLLVSCPYSGSTCKESVSIEDSIDELLEVWHSRGKSSEKGIEKLSIQFLMISNQPQLTVRQSLGLPTGRSSSRPLSKSSPSICSFDLRCCNTVR